MNNLTWYRFKAREYEAAYVREGVTISPTETASKLPMEVPAFRWLLRRPLDGKIVAVVTSRELFTLYENVEVSDGGDSDERPD